MPFQTGGSKRRESLGKPAEVCRMTMLGASGVGKTSLVKRFLNLPLTGKYKPTIGDIIDIKDHDIEIVDASGSNEFPAMQRLYIDSSDAFIIVMAVDSVESVDEAKRLRQSIFQRRRTSRPGSLHSNDSSPPNSNISHASHRESGQEPRVVYVINKIDIEGKSIDIASIQDDPDFGRDNIVLASAKENWNIDEILNHLVNVRSNLDCGSPDSPMEPSASPIPNDIVRKSVAALEMRRRSSAQALSSNNCDQFLNQIRHSLGSTSHNNYNQYRYEYTALE